MSDEETISLSAPCVASRPSSRESVRTTQARAYARLLVSDIRLYHEPDVILGRAAGDLARRLSGPLSRARGAYRARFDDEALLECEIVRILAGGDPRRLGPS